MTEFDSDNLSDELIKHSILLLYLVPTLGQEQIDIIDSDNTRLKVEILDFLESNEEYKYTNVQQSRIKKFREAIKDLRGSQIKRAYDKLLSDMTDLATLEQQYLIDAMLHFEDKELKPVSESKTGKATNNALILGSTMLDIYTRLIENDTTRIVGDVLDGINNNYSDTQIMRSVFGTRKSKYNDGVLQTTRNDVNNRNRDSGIIRNIVRGIASTASDLVWSENTSKVKYLLYVAILDSRTSEICRGRAYKKYLIGTQPAIPAHRNCRSHYEPWTGRNVKYKSYSQFFASQNKDFQKFILGESKYKQYKRGDFEVNRFVNEGRKMLTMKDIYE